MDMAGSPRLYAAGPASSPAQRGRPEKVPAYGTKPVQGSGWRAPFMRDPDVALPRSSGLQALHLLQLHPSPLGHAAVAGLREGYVADAGTQVAIERRAGDQ